MTVPPQKRHWMIGMVVTIAMLIALGFVARRWIWPADEKHAASEKGLESSRKVDRPVSETLELPAKTVEIMNLRTVQAVLPKYSRVLHLRGSLAIDPNRLVHVHARFSGQIIELATVGGLRSQQAEIANGNIRPLQTFDTIKNGMEMAMVWSKELGEKKSQLAESLAKLRLDKQTLANYLDLSKKRINFGS